VLEALLQRGGVATPGRCGPGSVVRTVRFLAGSGHSVPCSSGCRLVDLGERDDAAFALQGRGAPFADEGEPLQSFFGTLQLELLDRRSWPTRRALANAIFEDIEAWCNRADATRRSRCSAPYSTNRHTQASRPRDAPEPSGNRVKLKLRKVGDSWT
jgi:hypothetical protein